MRFLHRNDKSRLHRLRFENLEPRAMMTATESDELYESPVMELSVTEAPLSQNDETNFLSLEAFDGDSTPSPVELLEPVIETVVSINSLLSSEITAESFTTLPEKSDRSVLRYELAVFGDTSTDQSKERLPLYTSEILVHLERLQGDQLEIIIDAPSVIEAVATLETGDASQIRLRATLRFQDWEVEPTEATLVFLGQNSQPETPNVDPTDKFPTVTDPDDCDQGICAAGGETLSLVAVPATQTSSLSPVSRIDSEGVVQPSSKSLASSSLLSSNNRTIHRLPFAPSSVQRSSSRREGNDSVKASKFETLQSTRQYFVNDATKPMMRELRVSQRMMDQRVIHIVRPLELRKGTMDPTSQSIEDVAMVDGQQADAEAIDRDNELLMSSAAAIQTVGLDTSRTLGLDSVEYESPPVNHYSTARFSILGASLGILSVCWVQRRKREQRRLSVAT